LVFRTGLFRRISSGVDGIFWQKRNGNKGKEVSKAVYNRLDKIDYWQSYVIEQASDYLAYRDYEEKEAIHLT